MPAQLTCCMPGSHNTQTHLRREQVAEAAKGRVVGEVADALRACRWSSREAHQPWWIPRSNTRFSLLVRQKSKPPKLLIVQLEQRERKGDDGWEAVVHIW